MARRQEPSLLCSFSNYTTSEALAADCEPSEWTGQEVGRGRGGGGRGTRHVGQSGRQRRKRADGDSVNEVNGKNGKGENQSG